MIRSMIPVAAALFSCAIGAQQPCPAKTQPVSCFVDSAMTSLSFCQLAGSLEIQLENLNGKRATFACVDDGLKYIAPLYARAITSTSSKDQSERLKAFYAGWRAGIQGVRPGFNELAIAYKTRQGSLQQDLAGKAERLKLD